ncbi:16S rRNA (guanine(527)-N(7))-methyltransferase RsmG [Sphingomonas sp.]|uniref:16S rRNA (guanine(527)-N(7))-methyltransferase RsmG n=1 Tax=Sphingomonas sp. TaxID=28214 RepID=UPI003B3BADB6
MTEEEALEWLAVRNVPRGTLDKLDLYTQLLRREASAQNLVSASTLDAIWSRHIVDSAQLLDHAGSWGKWIDLGSGAGFPGLVVALIGQGKVTLVEARAKRVTFLREVAAATGIEDRVTVIAGRVETAEKRRFDVISARAFAPLEKLLTLGLPFSDKATRWVLPKGKSAAEELAASHGSWQGSFELVPSVTDSQASIIVATGVASRKRR